MAAADELARVLARCRSPTAEHLVTANLEKVTVVARSCRCLLIVEAELRILLLNLARRYYLHGCRRQMAAALAVARGSSMLHAVLSRGTTAFFGALVRAAFDSLLQELAGTRWRHETVDVLRLVDAVGVLGLADLVQFGL